MAAEHKITGTEKWAREHESELGNPEFFCFLEI
jgi:hypothetical protein